MNNGQERDGDVMDSPGDMMYFLRVDELTTAELLSSIGLQLKIANENLNDNLDGAGLRRMHNALVLMLHVLADKR